MIAVLLSRESERDRCRLQEINFNQYCKIIPLFIFHSGSAASERQDRNLSISGDILRVDSNTAGKKLRPQRVDSSTYIVYDSLPSTLCIPVKKPLMQIDAKNQKPVMQNIN